jgi:hypothetical protein
VGEVDGTELVLHDAVGGHGPVGEGGQDRVQAARVQAELLADPTPGVEDLPDSDERLVAGAVAEAVIASMHDGGRTVAVEFPDLAPPAT